MRAQHPFYADDLVELDERLLARADRVVPMRDIAKGDIGHKVIGLRHDVDDNRGSLDTAVAMAEWEFERGYSSTYYLLHDSHYWGEDAQVAAIRMHDLGHEVGLHVNGIAEAIRQQRSPLEIVTEALEFLRVAVPVDGCVAHGDPLCHEHLFVNDEMFLESLRPSYGAPGRRVGSVVLQPTARAALGLTYDANWLPRGNYLSDSGGKWSQPVGAVEDKFGTGQLHMLVHPDWWSRAFVGVTV